MHTRQKNESILDYMVRICENKDSLDLTWEDIKECINKETGDSFSSDKYRKWWKTFVQCREYLFSQNKTLLTTLEDAKTELFKEKVRMQDQRRELQKLQREDARIEHIRDEIIKEIQSLAQSKPLIALEPPKVTAKRWREGAMLISDWHKGLFARNYWNNFDDEEFLRRVKSLLRQTIENGKESAIRILHVFLMGDLVNGLIHVTSRILATEDVISQTMKVAEVISEVLVELASNFGMIFVYAVRGNHDRVTPNKKDELTQESFADLVTWYLKARLKDIKNIVFVDNTYDSEMANANICGYECFVVHGHRDKITDVVQNWSLMTKKIPDYVFMGHVHHHEENEIQGVEVIVNSSLSGVDSYAKDIRKVSKPAQKLIIFQKDYGRKGTNNMLLTGVQE